MNKKIRWITETAVMIALLVALQAITKPLGQLVTGSCVNTILALSALLGGLSCGITVALVSPVMAFLLGIAPQILTGPAIMAGNTVFVILLSVIAQIPALAKTPLAAVQNLSIGGTSVIIVVGVALETVKALEAQMLMRHYKGFLD